MMDDRPIALEFLILMKDTLEERAVEIDNNVKKWDERINRLNELVETAKENNGTVQVDDEEYADLMNDEKHELPFQHNNADTKEKIKKAVHDENLLLNLVSNKESKLYLICNGVEACSKMIKIGDNFSSKALRNIPFGKHTYLLGKDEMTRFICVHGAIIGFYWDRKQKIVMEYGFDLTGDDYYFDERHADQFNKIAKIITFVELGDIDVEIIEKGRNNGKPKAAGKVANTSEFTVYVVDSSWNKLIIRTEGFAVMGHFRLQPCGAGLIDRKLIWINAFEKHGYKRQPKAKIIHN